MKNLKANYIPYHQTNRFSNLVYDYVNEAETLKKFIVDFPSQHSILEQLNKKKNQMIDRTLLADVLMKQYQTLSKSEAVETNILSLQHENTFTFCTAHQPLIFTGHLYFIYKLIDIIQLTKSANLLFPQYHFVPIFYIGSEDHDMDEIGSLSYNNQEYRWETSQTGACGRMKTEGLESIVADLIRSLNKDIKDEAEMIDLLQSAYDGKKTLTEATRFLLHALFKDEGLLVLDADDISLKRNFISVMKNELLSQDAEAIVKSTSAKLSLHYNLQANPRPINLFYLHERLRERIEKVDERWVVHNTTISFSKDELLSELETFPNRFSPNVILRPLYQETILPNLMVIGGGGELAYWLELKKLFEYHHLVFPQIVLRSSVLWIDSKSSKLMAKLPCNIEQLFLDKQTFFKQFVQQDSRLVTLKNHLNDLEIQYMQIKELAQDIAPSLGKSMEAHRAKAKHIEQRIKQKFEAEIKRQEFLLCQRIDKLNESLFPNGQLQERHDNFLSIYKMHGKQMFTILLAHQKPMDNLFLVLHESD